MHLFDLSEYQSKIFDPTNKNIIDKMKDAYKGIPIKDLLN